MRKSTYIAALPARHLTSLVTAVFAVAAAGCAAKQQPSAPQPSPPPTTQSPWAERTASDIEAAFTLFTDNHPGVHDPRSPRFVDRLERAREAGLRYAAEATSMDGYRVALAEFSAELGDGHALVVPAGDDDWRADATWPGFIAAWRGDGMYVHHKWRGDVEVGSRIVECDGVAVVDFVESRMRRNYARAAEAGQWWRNGPRAFVDFTASTDDRPRSCTFRSPDRTEREVGLQWTAVPDDLPRLLAASTDGERLPIGLSEPRPGLFLVSLPDFSPDAGGVERYEALYAELAASSAALSGARAVVLDLRHNHGGSSAWSRRIASRLWGEEVVEAKVEQLWGAVEIWWRSSPGNAAHVARMAHDSRAAGEDFADYLERVALGMRGAARRGDPFYVHHEVDEADEADAVPAADEIATSFTTPTWVITPGACASACLDAVDLFRAFDNVALIGAPTSADSTYMEVRSAELPSGRGRAVIPTKIWVGRPRAAGEIYEPDVVVTDLDWSTASFLDHIERQL